MVQDADGLVGWPDAGLDRLSNVRRQLWGCGELLEYVGDADETGRILWHTPLHGCEQRSAGGV